MKIKKTFQSIFKAIAIFIFKLIYGKVKENNKLNSNLKYFKEEINFEGCENIYNLFKINNARLYTDRIQDTAIIKNNIIIKEASVQLRNNFNSTVNKNIVIKKGTPRFLKKLNGNVLSLLTGGGGNNNYFHWFFDVLPRLGIFEKNLNLKKLDYLLCPNLNSWQIKSLELLGFKKEQLLSSVKYRHIFSDAIYTTSHPWNFNPDIINDIENIPNWISVWLKKKFLDKKSEKIFPKRIYIDRSDSNSNVKEHRSIINEKEIIEYLKKEKFELIQLSKLDLEDEIKIFNSAEIVVGLQGAGFTNLIWSNNKTKIIELRSKYTNKLYQNLAKQNEINFNFIESEPVGTSIAKHYGAININLEELKKLI